MQQAVGQVADQAGLFRQGNEFERIDDLKGAVPTGQDFEANYAPCLQIHNRLVIRNDFIPLQRAGQLAC